MDISSNDRSAMMPNYSFPDLVPEKALGSRLWDENGKEYIDFGGGIAVTSLGHCHPELMRSMEEQSKKLWHVSNYLLSKPAKELGQKIASKSFADKVLFSNSGNEANEAAIKLARKYFFEKGDDEKYEILSFTNSFHGRSLANITLGDSEFHQTGFGPLPKGFVKAVQKVARIKDRELFTGFAQNDLTEFLDFVCFFFVFVDVFFFTFFVFEIDFFLLLFFLFLIVFISISLISSSSFSFNKISTFVFVFMPSTSFCILLFKYRSMVGLNLLQLNFFLLY